MAKIEVEGLYKIFGPHPKKAMQLLSEGKSKDEIMASMRHGVGVDNASFKVEEGEIVVVMGLSGSGKSTLVRCLNRLIMPTAGKILIDGSDVLTMGEDELRQLRQRKMGMVFQNFACSRTAPYGKTRPLAWKSRAWNGKSGSNWPTRPSPWSAWKAGENPIPGSFPAACSSAWVLPGLWP